MTTMAADETGAIIERLIRFGTEQDLVGRARIVCARCLRDYEEEIHPHHASDVQISFRSQALVFRNALIPYPYIDTRLALTIEDKEIGYYRLITHLDGTDDDDYFHLD